MYESKQYLALQLLTQKAQLIVQMMYSLFLCCLYFLSLIDQLYFCLSILCAVYGQLLRLPVFFKLKDPGQILATGSGMFLTSLTYFFENKSLQRWRGAVFFQIKNNSRLRICSIKKRIRIRPNVNFKKENYLTFSFFCHISFSFYH